MGAPNAAVSPRTNKKKTYGEPNKGNEPVPRATDLCGKMCRNADGRNRLHNRRRGARRGRHVREGIALRHGTLGSRALVGACGFVHVHVHVDEFNGPTTERVLVVQSFVRGFRHSRNGARVQGLCLHYDVE